MWTKKCLCCFCLLLLEIALAKPYLIETLLESPSPWHASSPPWQRPRRSEGSWPRLHEATLHLHKCPIVVCCSECVWTWYCRRHQYCWASPLPCGGGRSAFQVVCCGLYPRSCCAIYIFWIVLVHAHRRRWSMFWPQIRPHVIHGAVYAMQLHDVLALDFNGEEEEKGHTGTVVLLDGMEQEGTAEPHFISVFSSIGVCNTC